MPAPAPDIRQTAPGQLFVLGAWNKHLSEAYVPVRNAMARRFDDHMRWATRFFLAASSVWFFRVMVMIWFVVTGGIGIDTSDGTGWFIDAMSALKFLPLAVYEVHWRVRDTGFAAVRFGRAGFLWVAAVLFTIGVVLATLGMWFPDLG